MFPFLRFSSKFSHYICVNGLFTIAHKPTQKYTLSNTLLSSAEHEILPLKSTILILRGQHILTALISR